jgi:hypothetical protein
MKRREFVATVIAGGVAVPAFADKGGHRHEKIDGPLASATVSFGAWQSSPAPFDRFGAAATSPDPNDRTRNVHQLVPFEAKIKAGGTVNFILAGFHNVQIFEPGTTPEGLKSILATQNPPPLTTVANPPGPPIIDIAQGRIYRGLDPSTLPRLVRPADPVPRPLQDRVETVQLTEPGRYLVICGVMPHFVNDNMFGYVRVLRHDDD